MNTQTAITHRSTYVISSSAKSLVDHRLQRDHRPAARIGDLGARIVALGCRISGSWRDPGSRSSDRAAGRRPDRLGRRAGRAQWREPVSRGRNAHQPRARFAHRCCVPRRRLIVAGARTHRRDPRPMCGDPGSDYKSDGLERVVLTGGDAFLVLGLAALIQLSARLATLRSSKQSASPEVAISEARSHGR